MGGVAQVRNPKFKPQSHHKKTKTKKTQKTHPPNKKTNKQTKDRTGAGNETQVVKRLPHKYKALSSNLSTAKQRKTTENRTATLSLLFRI
jgi:sugar diacid utilization regulator